MAKRATTVATAADTDTDTVPAPETKDAPTPETAAPQASAPAPETKDTPTPGTDAAETTAPEASAPEAGAAAPVTTEAPVAAEPLLSLDALAQAHRVPGWRQAAVCRLMGWEAGKMVTSADYAAALATLTSRRQGGGRR